MLAALKNFLDRLAPPAPGADPAAAEHTLQLATAVLLVEVMRSDASFPAAERDAVLHGLREQFDLTAEEAVRLAELGEVAARDATDLYAFTSRLDERFDAAQKLAIVERMWRVAYADGTLAAHERHVLWRVADLLHVPHGDNMHARMRAEQSARHG